MAAIISSNSFVPAICNVKKIKLSSVLNNNLMRNSFSHDSFARDYAKNYVNLTQFQRVLLTAGSAMISMANPFRHDMIACLGETTGKQALKYCMQKMKSTEEGQKILLEKPRINSTTIDLSYLKNLPEGTIGKTYSNFLIENNVTPDSRAPVQYIDDFDLAFLMQRYREVHDLFHSITLMPTTMLGEVTVKWIEALQLKLPMCVAGAIFGAARLKPKHRNLYLNNYLPWSLTTGKNAKFLLGTYFEKRWEQSLQDFHNEYNIKPLQIQH